MVLGEAIVRIPDCANYSGAQVAHAADQVDEPVFDRIVKHAADGEVAPLRILFDRAEADR